MIAFAPSYDSATQENHKIITQLNLNTCITLLASAATRPLLVSSLLKHTDTPLFAMSHGTSNAIKQQDGGAALDSNDAPSIGRRHFFVFACNTANILGRVIAENGGVYWGYTGRIAAPDSTPNFGPFFVKIFSHIKTHWHEATDSTKRLTLLHEIKDMCEDASTAIEAMLQTDPAVDVASALLCLLNIWSRLKIWSGNPAQAEQHPTASATWLLD